MREKSSPWAAAAELFDPPPTNLAKYMYDPAGFVHDCFDWDPGEGPTDYQNDILNSIITHRRVAVRGPHGLGKTALDAWVILWFALTRDDAGIDWKLISTASAWQQLIRFLWPEVHKWAPRLNWDRVGRPPFNRHELLEYSLKLNTGEAFSVASEDPARLEGAHADSLFYVFDEAKTIPGTIFDAAEGAFSGAGGDTKMEAFALANSTPGETSGRFYEIHKKTAGFADWRTIHITLADAMRANRISQDWLDARKAQWGEKSTVYQNRVLGEFCANDEDGVIPLAWVEAANDRWLEWKAAGWLPNLKCVGVDIAAGGADKSVIAIRHGDVISELRVYDEADPTVTTGYVAGIIDVPGVYAVVDTIGIGTTPHRLLQNAGLISVPFNAAERTDRRDASGELGFVNQRAAAWWNMRELLDPAHHHEIALPSIDDKTNLDILTGDLTAPHWRVMAGGRIQIESKADIRKRIGRSTDAGDAVIQAFWPAGTGSPALAPSHGRYRSEMADVMTKEW